MGRNVKWPKNHKAKSSMNGGKLVQEGGSEDKEITEIITKALNASMDIGPGCKAAPALAEPPGPVPYGDWLLQALVVPVPLSLSHIWISGLRSFLTSLPGDWKS